MTALRLVFFVIVREVLVLVRHLLYFLQSLELVLLAVDCPKMGCLA